MQPIYATEADAAGEPWNLTPSGDSAILLRLASVLVDRACASALYDTDQLDMPEDPAVRQAFRDAVCAQLAVWSRGGIDPVTQAVGSAGGKVASKSAGGRSVTYATADPAEVLARARSTSALSGLALTYLPDDLFRQPVGRSWGW